MIAPLRARKNTAMAIDIVESTVTIIDNVESEEYTPSALLLGFAHFPLGRSKQGPISKDNQKPSGSHSSSARMDMGHGFREGVEYFNITFFGDVEILHGWVPRRIVSAHRTKRRHYFLEGNVQSRVIDGVCKDIRCDK